MARTYRGGYARSQATHAPAWKRQADGPGDTKVKAAHVAATKAAERQAVRVALAQGLEPEPSRWLGWWHMPPAPKPLSPDF